MLGVARGVTGRSQSGRRVHVQRAVSELPGAGHHLIAKHRATQREETGDAAGEQLPGLLATIGNALRAPSRGVPFLSGGCRKARSEQ